MSEIFASFVKGRSRSFALPSIDQGDSVPTGFVKATRVITNTVCYLALMLTSAKAGEGWQSMDLSKDPTSLSTILALLRNHERFAKWINGKPLGKFTYVSLRKDRNDPSKTVYVLLECDENNKPVRFLRVDEIAKLNVSNSKVPETAELTFEYPAAAVKATSLDHPSVQRNVEQMFQLFRSAQSTLYLVDDHYVEGLTEGEKASATLNKLSNQGILVLRLVSKAADKVSDAFNALSKSKRLVWDSTSIKRIRFELSPDQSTIGRLEIVGLFKTNDVRLQSPDAANLSKLEIKDNRTTEVALTEGTSRGVQEKSGEKEHPSTRVNWDTKD